MFALSVTADAAPARAVVAVRPGAIESRTLVSDTTSGARSGAAPAAGDADMRATARARGTDRWTAITVGRAILVQPLAAQLTRIRCEQLGTHRICGLVLSGVKFKRRLSRRGFNAEVSNAIRTAFAVAPLEEVDLWTTVPLAAGRGVVVSGDLAAPTSATVFAISVPRAKLAQLNAQLESGRDVYWDSAFADSLTKGLQ